MDQELLLRDNHMRQYNQRVINEYRKTSPLRRTSKSPNRPDPVASHNGPIDDPPDSGRYKFNKKYE